MAEGSTIGALRVAIGADVAGFKRGMDQAQDGLGRLRKAAMPAVAAIAAVGAAATAVGVGLYSMARSQMNVIDTQLKLARSVDGTVTGLRSLKWAAEDNGIDGLEQSLTRLNRRLGAVELGAGPAAVTVERLGLNLKELSSVDVDERLARIADAIKDSGMSSQEAARHLQNLGFQQAEATQLFMQGGDAIRGAREEIELYGLAVDDLDAAKIEEANNQFARLGLVVEGLKTKLAVELAPVLLEIAQRFNILIRNLIGTHDKTKEAEGALDDLKENNIVHSFVRPLAVGLARVVDVLNTIIKTVQLVGAAFKAVAADIKAFTSSTAIAQIEMQQQSAQQFGEFGTPGEQFVEGLQIDQSKAAAAIDEHKKVLEERNKVIADFNEQLSDWWTGGNHYEQKVIEAFEAPLPGVTLGPTTDDGEGGGGGGIRSGSGAMTAVERVAEENEAIREQLELRLEMFRELAADEMELEFFKHEQQMEQLRELWEEGIIPTEEEYMELKEELEQQHQDRLSDIQARAEAERIKNVQRAGQMEMQLRQGVVQNAIALLDQFAQKNKAAALASIVLNKAVAIARIAQTTAEASMLAYASQLIPGDPSSPARAAAAAAKVKALGTLQMGLVAATGIAQAAGVMSGGTGGLSGGASGSVGGRSSAPTSSAGSGAIAEQTPEPKHSRVTINLQGENFTRSQVRDLIEQINEATADGAVLRLD